MMNKALLMLLRTVDNDDYHYSCRQLRTLSLLLEGYQEKIPYSSTEEILSLYRLGCITMVVALLALSAHTEVLY